MANEMGPRVPQLTTSAYALVAFFWNRWPDSIEMGGRIAPECAALMALRRACPM